MKRTYLTGIWKMTGNGYSVEGRIPGSVYSFLHVDNDLLPDPYFRDNEDIYTRLAEHDYVFERVFLYEHTDNVCFLVFEGLDTLCSIYLNGQKVSDTDNMHVKYSFDVGNLLRDGENVLKVVCHSAIKYMREMDNKAKLFGATDCMSGYPYLRKAHSMMGWDWGPRLPDAGIWRDVYLTEKDSFEIIDVDVLQKHINGDVFITPKVDFDGGAVEIILTSPKGEQRSLSPNAENLIENPMLWWPNGLGEQNLYRLTVVLLVEGKKVDERVLNIGLREMRLVRKTDEFGESFYHEVNGVDVFAMGADYIPEDNIFSRITCERTRALLTHCKNCNFNAIRVWGGGYYPDDFFFDICDELGLIVFFDLMFACSVYDPDEKAYAGIETEVRQNLRRIRHHACIGLVCGNNEIEWHFHDYVSMSGREDRDHLTDVYRNLFENRIPSIINEIAPYISYIPSSPTSFGSFFDPNGENAGDCHDWDSDYISSRTRVQRYVSEFGFQSLPDIKTVESFTYPEDRNLCSYVMERHQRSLGGNELILSQMAKMFRYPSGLECLIYTSQLLQAESVRYRVEHWRRNRGRCMGALYWQLNDIWPVISWSSIDYRGRYKALQYAAKRFYSPVLISCEEIGEAQNRRYVNVEKGKCDSDLSARLCVTNDTLKRISGVVVWKVCDPYSNTLREGREDISVDPMSAKWLDKLAFSDIAPGDHHLQFEFIVDGKSISSGVSLFTQPKYYNFADPCLECRVEGDELTITSKAFAMGVKVSDENNDLLLDDNYFNMEAGEIKVRILSGEAKNIHLCSIYDVN